MKRYWWGWCAVAVLMMNCQTAWGWSKSGHMVIARIAYDHLSTKARKNIKPLIEATIPQGVSMTMPEAFVESSHWADDIAFRDKKYKIAHYIDLPYNADGNNRPYLQPAEDVVRALNECVTALTSDKASRADQVDMLRYLIHFVGDVHQPMHAVSLYNAQYPEGDRGGNSIKLPGGRENLHHYWDTALRWLPAVGRDTTPKDISTVRETAKLLTKLYPKQSLKEEGETDFMAWANESHALAVSAAYAGITAGVEPTDAYEKANQQVAQRRIALAGYRLADLLNRVYK